MARYAFTAPRLYVEPSLGRGVRIELDRNQTNYLVTVLRLGDGAAVLVFNGRDGEWRARLSSAGRRSVALVSEELTRPQPVPGDLHYLFAPLKHARLDYMVQKAVEMGATRLQPVLTRHTQMSRINLERMRANIVEAAEQCGILTIPSLGSPLALDRLLDAWPGDRFLVFCDEDAPPADPVTALRTGSRRTGGLAVLIGPEGGFDGTERAALLALPHVARMSLGPRILRADTAAVAALALVQAILGDGSAEPTTILPQ